MQQRQKAHGSRSPSASSIHDVMYLCFLFSPNEARVHEGHPEVQQDGAPEQRYEERWLQRGTALRFLLQIWKIIPVKENAVIPGTARAVTERAHPAPLLPPRNACRAPKTAWPPQGHPAPRWGRAGRGAAPPPRRHSTDRTGPAPLPAWRYEGSASPVRCRKSPSVKPPLRAVWAVLTHSPPAPMAPRARKEQRWKAGCGPPASALPSARPRAAPSVPSVSARARAASLHTALPYAAPQPHFPGTAALRWNAAVRPEDKAAKRTQRCSGSAQVCVGGSVWGRSGLADLFYQVVSTPRGERRGLRIAERV